MNLPVGTRLGNVEILSFIGAGGMGEVYRARDTRLKRDIAVKVLPAAWASHRDRLARFQREAEVLARLNHPNIAAIYGVKDADGTPALLLELVEGPTLADRLTRGPIAIAEALSIARQVADALEAAHEQGIVHRDLKPANIKVRDDGRVKVLDLGLAKTFEPETSAGAATELPTATDLKMTGPGMILGTAAYMSPEQARGQAVDRRTDIWAFGCVLYEMLTGHVAFARSTAADTLAAVVGQPPNWTALPTQTPPLVVRLLRRCLEKDIRRRFRDVADARLDLEDADNPSPVAAEPRIAGPRVLPTIAAVSALVAVVTGAALWSLAGGDGASVPEPVRFTIEMQPGEEVPLDGGLPRPLAITRDGRSIVYAARSPSGSRLYLRQMADGDARPIAGTEGGSGPFLSPDGQWLGFASGGFIRKVPILGGTPQAITRATGLLGATWSDDGSIVFHSWESGLFRVAAEGGTPEPLTRLDGQGKELSHQAPYSLPGGRAVVFTVFQEGRLPAVELVQLPSGERRRLLEGADPQYLSSGHLMFTRGGRLHTVPFDLARLEVTGPAAPTADETFVSVTQGRGTLATSLDGTLAYIPAATPKSRLVLVDRHGATRPVVDEPHNFSHPRFAPDGTRLVVRVAAETGGGELWVHDLARDNRWRLSVNGGISRPVWSHDGTRITFSAGGEGIYSIPADDSGPPEILLARDSSGPVFPLGWSRDGRTFVYSRPAPETNRDVFTLSADGTRTPILVTPRDERSAMLSPDGRWMVYAALEPGREEEVYVQRHPGPGERVVVSVGGGREPVWSPSGDEIFYRSIEGDRMLVVQVRTEPTLTVERPHTLFQGAFGTGLFWADYDVSPTTGEFLMLAVDQSLQPRLTVVLNTTRSLSRHRQDPARNRRRTPACSRRRPVES